MFGYVDTTLSPMFSGRSYSRGNYERERTSFLVWILSAMVAGSVIQWIAAKLNPPGIDYLLELSRGQFNQGYFWTLLTYPLVHAHVLLLVFTGLAVYFLGRELSPHLGERRILFLAGTATLLGGLAWLGVHWHDSETTLSGASPILWCYLTVFACLFPNREISFLIFFVIPVRMRPKYIAATLAGFDLLGLAFLESSPQGLENVGLAHSAHLAAMVTGWVYFRYIHRANWTAQRAGAEPSPRSSAPQPKAADVEVVPDGPANVGVTEDIRAQVDRILDKINSQGLGALTPREKQVLDEARDALSRR